MYASIRCHSLVTLLAVGCCSLSAPAGEKPTVQKQILNVVLIELNTGHPPEPTLPVINDWTRWDRTAGGLIESLESILGYKRADGGMKHADASLFAIRAAARGLDDAKSLSPLASELDRICAVTGRPSLFFLWLSAEGLVLVAVYDGGEIRAQMAFAMLATIHHGEAIAGGLSSAYIAPPCVAWRRQRHIADREAADAWCRSPYNIAKLLHLLRGTEGGLILGAALRSIRESTPAGTSITALQDPAIGQIIWNTFGAAPSATVDLITSYLHDTVGLQTADTFGSAFRDDSFGRFAVDNLFQASTWNPMGVLLEPDLIVVVDESGLTSGLKQKAVAAVRDKPAGEFQHEGKRKWAARAPGTAGLFEVPGGTFRLHQMDVVVERQQHNAIRLDHFYDSSAFISSPLGSGWSIEPFALEISRRLPMKGAEAEVAIKPILIDRRAGVRLRYRLDTGATAAPRPSDLLTVASYRKVSSSLQPDLTARADGGYLASFAHGFQIAFNEAGRIEWMGRGEVDRVTYVHASPLLKEIRGAEASIILEYDNHGRLRDARTSSGQSSAYMLDDAGRLKSVSGSESGNFMFTYGADNRLATVALGTKNLTTNTYDDKGRMLTHRTPQGRWRFAYDDRIGRMTVSGPDGKVTDYYYDAQRRLAAYGAAKDRMTLFNYDVSGRILQVAMAELLNDPSRGELPRFKVSEMVTPLPREETPAEKEPS